MAISEIAPWVAVDRAHFHRHRDSSHYVRDLFNGEPKTLHSKVYAELQGGEWPGPSLYDELQRRMRHVPADCKIRVAVLKLRPGTYLRIPTLDWEGRDKSKVFQLLGRTNLREVSIDEVIARCKEMAEWDQEEAG